MGGPLAASSIVLGNPEWGTAVFLAVGAFLVLLIYTTTRSTVDPKWKWTFFGLKSAAVALLALCLLDPQVSRSRAKPGENIVVLLVDQSASMGIGEQNDSSKTRGERTAELLNPEQPWHQRLAQDFDVRKYTFGTQLNRVDGFRELTFESEASNLAAAVNGLKTRFERQPLAAILLFSDGNSTDGLPAELAKVGVPVFPVVEPSADTLEDIAVSDISVTQTNFEDSPVRIQARVQFHGPRPDRVVASLEQVSPQGEATKIIETQTIPVPEDRDLLIRMQLRPDRSGALFYRLNVRNEKESSSGTQETCEATLANNERLIAVNRDPRIARILYVGGRPNWEHKFLNRALADDPQLQLSSLIRIAAREARFDFRGRAGESTNPLFRGFKSEADEATEDYSQPVLIRLNMRDASELSEGFPKEKRRLYEFDGLILDDVEAGFFSHDQQVLIDRFVAERGGGLMMLGGVNSFRNGKWDRTPVADALPVYLNAPFDGPSQSPTREFYSWGLTREGWLEPWMRLRETEQAELSRLDESQKLSILSRISQTKPGARILAEMTDTKGNRFPAIVIQQYGQGRSAAVLPGDIWKEFMHAETPEQQKDPARFWRQVARWLTGDGLKRLDVQLATTPGNGFPVTQIQVRVRNREFQPDENARVNVQVQTPDGSEIPLDVQPSLEEPGLFEATFVARESGPYVAQVTIPGQGDDPVQKTEVGWTSDPTAKEFESVAVNQTLLEQLVDQTGGKIIPQAQLLNEVSALSHREVPLMEVETRPLWHSPWVLLLAIALLCGEWGLRRRKGLA